MTVNWRDQYDRMLRGLGKIESIYATTYSREDPIGKAIFIGRDNYPDMRDAITHFFQDCLHLRDWITKALVLSDQDRQDIIDSFKAESAMRGLPICRDIAVGEKHVVVKDASIDSEARLSHTGTAHVHTSDKQFHLRFKIEMPNAVSAVDVLDLARTCVEEWQKLLRDKKIIT